MQLSIGPARIDAFMSICFIVSLTGAFNVRKDFEPPAAFALYEGRSTYFAISVPDHSTPNRRTASALQYDIAYNHHISPRRCVDSVAKGRLVFVFSKVANVQSTSEDEMRQ